MDVSEPYDSDMEPPASLLHKKAIAKFSRFLVISRFFDDTEEEIQARIRARLAIEEAQQALEEASSKQKAPTSVVPAPAPLVSKVDRAPPPKASVSFSKTPAPVLSVSAPAPKGSSGAQNVIPATPNPAMAASVVGATATSLAPGAPCAADTAVASGTHTAADTTFAAASGAEQQGSRGPYPSTKNGYRSGPVLRTCRRPLSGKYIEISDDSEDN